MIRKIFEFSLALGQPIVVSGLSDQRVGLATAQTGISRLGIHASLRWETGHIANDVYHELNIWVQTHISTGFL